MHGDDALAVGVGDESDIPENDNGCYGEDVSPSPEAGSENQGTLELHEENFAGKRVSLVRVNRKWQRIYSPI